MPRLVWGERLVIATHNQGKLAELRVLLDPYGIEAVSAGDLGLPEPDETAADFTGNAILKARAASDATQLPALADDSGFCVAALDGAPGILSARWAGPEKDFNGAMGRVHRLTLGNPDCRAWFICALSVAWPDGLTQSWLGRVDGTRVWPPRGSKGFGYDPMFVPDGESITFGEMVPAAKEADSHRARAFTAFRTDILGQA